MTHGLALGRLDRAEPLADPPASEGDAACALRQSLVSVVAMVLLGCLATPVAGHDATPGGDTTWPKLEQSIEYGDDPKQIIHAYELEPGETPRPAVVFFSGGGYDIGDPLWVLDSARQMAEAGLRGLCGGGLSPSLLAGVFRPPFA